MDTVTGSWTSLRLIKKIRTGRRRTFLGWPVVGPDAIYVSDPEGDTIKVDRKSLDLVWRIKFPRKFEAGFICGDGLVFVRGFNTDEIGVLRADSGDLVWTRGKVGGGADFWRGKLLTTVPQSEGGGLKVVDPATGEVIDWIPLPGRIGTKGRCGDLLLFTLFEGQDDLVRALDLRERRYVWERDLLSEMKARGNLEEENPTISFVPGSEGRFVATAGGATFGCSLGDGKILWHAPVPVPYYWPNVHEGRVYVLLYGRFFAIDETTGEIVYETHHPELKEVLYMKAGTVYGGKLAIPTESGHLPVFDLSNGRLASLDKYDATLWRTAEADGRLLVTTGEGKLLVFADEA